MGVGDWEGNLVTSWCLHCGRLWCALELLGADGCGRGSPGLGSGFWAPGLGAGAHLSVAGGSGRTQLGHPGQGHREGGTWKTTHRTTTKLTRGRPRGHPKARL